VAEGLTQELTKGPTNETTPELTKEPTQELTQGPTNEPTQELTQGPTPELIIEPRAAFPAEIAGWLAPEGAPAFRGRQIFTWLQKEAAPDYQGMTNLPQSLRQGLAEAYPVRRPDLRRRQVSRDGTKKYLFVLADGVPIEAVLMLQREADGRRRHTLCLSSQAGCAMGCRFCATGEKGWRRDLTAAEIVGQALEVISRERRETADFGLRNIVYMGMGEPLQNYDPVLRSVRLLNHPAGQRIGIRRITLSTCGLPEQIRRLAAENLDLVLAVSLHAADDQTRSELMPINRRYPLGELLAACRHYVQKTGRRLTFEYIMIRGVNTDQATARAICRLLRGIPCNINLIPVNPGGHGFQRPPAPLGEAFRQRLAAGGIPAVIREERGGDIAGACGQLAGQYEA
jgi:23S rRNA (adenine2503-C2)-methyltransferase